MIWLCKMIITHVAIINGSIFLYKKLCQEPSIHSMSSISPKVIHYSTMECALLHIPHSCIRRMVPNGLELAKMSYIRKD